MNRWVLAATTTAMLAALAGCNSDSDNDDAVVEPPAVVTPDSINLSFLGRYSAGIFAESAAEIPAFDPVNKRIFIVNAQKGAVDVLDATDPANPTLIDTLTAADVAADAVVNSIAYKGGYLAVAIEASPKTDNGFVALYDATTLDLLGSAQVGAQPDMLAFSPDGKYLLTANEGEPSNDYSVDPVGSISILSLTDDEIVEVRTATFSSFNARRDELIQAGVRIFGPNASVEQDLEPEYIAISEDSSTAWVALQENNALAKIDIASATVTEILPLGYKDHGVAGNGIDASDEDGEI
ncbi:MAG TPA: alkaline phosphatase, partial [Pseudomonas sp.]|nr:alkaline phosphatase [Pseudomonas sp.]